MPEILEVTKSWVTVCRKSWIFLLMEEYIFLTYFLIDVYEKSGRRGKGRFLTTSGKKCFFWGSFRALSLHIQDFEWQQTPKSIGSFIFDKYSLTKERGAYE